MDITGMGGSETAQLPDKQQTNGMALVDSMQVTVASRMPLANAILFVLVLRQMVILHLSGCRFR